MLNQIHLALAIQLIVQEFIKNETNFSIFNITEKLRLADQVSMDIVDLPFSTFAGGKVGRDISHGKVVAIFDQLMANGFYPELKSHLKRNYKHEQYREFFVDPNFHKDSEEVENSTLVEGYHQVIPSLPDWRPKAQDYVTKRGPVTIKQVRSCLKKWNGLQVKEIYKWAKSRGLVSSDNSHASKVILQ